MNKLSIGIAHHEWTVGEIAGLLNVREILQVPN